MTKTSALRLFYCFIFASFAGTAYAQPNFYVLDQHRDIVQVFSSNGAYLSQLGSPGGGNGQLANPNGIAMDASGNMWVVDTLNERVEGFSANGAYLSQFGSFGTGNGQFRKPYSIAIDGSGNFWVTDLGNSRVHEFNSSGTYLLQFGSAGSGNGQFNVPYGIAIDANGNIWVTDSGNSRVEEFSSGGTYLSQFGSAGSSSGQFSFPSGIAIDFNGNIWVTDSGNNRVQEFSSTGTYLSQFGSYGSGNGQFSDPGSIAVDANGNIWVTDNLNSRVQGFSPNGAYLSQFGSNGSGNGQFLMPVGIFVVPNPPPPPVGTVLWTNSGDGSGFASIVPAVPSATGVADIFGLQNDGTIAAIASTGTTAWTASVGTDSVSLTPDFQGGLVVCDATTNSIYKLDGITGQAYPAYAPNSNSAAVGCNLPGTISLAVHPDGTIFELASTNVNGNFVPTLTGIDPTTGSVKFTVPTGGCLGGIIVAGDGNAYACYTQETGTFESGATQVSVMQVSSSGASVSIPITVLPYWTIYGLPAYLITNADTGILISVNNPYSGGPFMAITNGTSASLIGQPVVSGQGSGQPVIPVLQREDGSFVGTTYNTQGGPVMVAFDQSGSLLWTVSNDQPQIANPGGGVIGQSGTTYDQNGNVSRQAGSLPLPVQSWTGNGYTYNPLAQVAIAPATYATTFAAVSGREPIRQQNIPYSGEHVRAIVCPVGILRK